MKSYLRFGPNLSATKTAVVAVYAARSDEQLGTIRWYGAWRQYVYEPREATIYSAGCQDEISAHIRGLMAARRTKAAA